MPVVADRRADDADRPTRSDAERREVSASNLVVTSADTDAAIRAAAKVAIDAGDIARARALLDVLDARSPAASVLTLAPCRAPK